MISLYYNEENNYTGPGKVILNLKKGLDIIGENYQCNIGTENIVCMQKHPIMNEYKNIVIGTNVCVLPVDNEIIMKQEYKSILVPSQWVKDLYAGWLNSEKIKIWAVGIDTEKFKPIERKKTRDCLIYFKNRNENELKIIYELLEKFEQSYYVLVYGNYSENLFYDLLTQCRYGILLDGTESQGIAVMEMMSCGFPLYVWNKKKWDDRKDVECEATSIPYFDETCGIEKDNYKSELSFKYFIDYLNTENQYNPRKYILDNFTLVQKAKDFVEIIK